jgi:Type IV secretion-system coupling protein DNA-binding domain
MSRMQPILDHLATSVAFPSRLFDWIVGLATAVAVGCVGGAVVARMMRARDVHWGWSALVLLACLPLRSALGGLALPLGFAALVATRRVRNRHQDELDAGADLRARAARRRSPVDAVRMSLAALELLRLRRDARGWFRGDELIVGRDDRGALVSVPFGGVRGGSHMLVVGATGSGKTVTQTWIAVRAIERGVGAVVIDPKGDRAMRAALARAAHRCDRRLIEWTTQGPAVYNPFAHGGETEIADKLLAGERFSEPHYLRQAQRYIGHVVRALRGAGFEVSLQAVSHHLDPRCLDQLVRGQRTEDAERTRSYLDSLTARQSSDLAGVRDRLAIIAESDVGRWLDPSEPSVERFDLLQAVRARAIVYFDLAADSRPLLTQMLGAAIVQDLTTTVATLQRAPLPTVVVIDEFSSIAAEQVVRLFGRARSAGVSVVLGAQELADLRMPGHTSLLEQVLGNVTVLVAHRQVVPASAELVAGLAGTVGVWRTSRLGDGRVTRTRVREGALAPSDVMGLATGSAAAIVPGRSSSASIARILSLETEEER